MRYICMIDSQRRAKQLKYEVRVDPHIAVRADWEKLQQILLNLLCSLGPHDRSRKGEGES